MCGFAMALLLTDLQMLALPVSFLGSAYSCYDGWAPRGDDPGRRVRAGRDKVAAGKGAPAVGGDAGAGWMLAGGEPLRGVTRTGALAANPRLGLAPRPAENLPPQRHPSRWRGPINRTRSLRREVLGPPDIVAAARSAGAVMRACAHGLRHSSVEPLPNKEISWM